MISCIIVDDEPMARQGIQEDIKEIGFINLVGIAENAMQANEVIAKTHPALILLDIQMPKITGLEFLKTLQHPPMVIIISAYSEYALEGYQLDVIDYLVKPVSFNRLLKACNKAKEFYELRLKDPATFERTYFFVKCGSRYEMIFFKDILFVEAADNYILLHTEEKKIISYLTLKSIEEYLPAGNFVKVHKSFIVALDKISHIEGNEITIRKRKIPIGRNLKEDIMNRIVIDKIVKR